MPLDDMDYRSAKLTSTYLWRGDANNRPAEEDRLGKGNLEFTLNKLLKGAGAGANPTEIDGLADLAEKAHGSLTGVTSNQHHAQSHTLASHSTKAHTELTGVTSDQHHAQSHNAASHSDIASTGADIDDAVTKRHAQNTDTDLSPAHKDATTGVHGVGASTVESISGSQGKVDTHANIQTAGIHGSASAATANKLVHRDASGRAKFAAPGAAGDALIKGTAITDTEHGVRTLANAHAHGNLSGIGANDHHAQSHTHASHTGVGASDHHIKTTSFADITDRAGASKLNWGLNKLLKGAGAGADPTEIDGYTDAEALAAAEAGGVSAATANKLVKRDASARAKFAAPGASGDALIKGTRVTVAELPALTNNKIWKGTGANPTEIDVPVTATKEFFVPVTYGTEMTYRSYFPVAKCDAANDQGFIAFHVPYDFSIIIDAVIIVRPGATQAAADWLINASYGAVGESYATHSETDSTTTYNVTVNILYEVDISGILSSLAAGDYVGVRLQQTAAGHDVEIIGMRFKYS